MGFAKFYEYGSEGEYNYMVMELLGPNLEQFAKLCAHKLSMKTVLILGLQMIDRIEVLHNAGFVYKDIKPENFVMGLENKSHILHLIDFGKCKRYKNKDTGKHLPYKENCQFDGEYLFSSINTHNKTEYSRRDDIEGILYLMIYLRKGKLPWHINREYKSKKERDTLIEEIKKKVPVENLAFKMPMTFVDLLTYIRTINYYERPDYDYIRLLMHRAFSPDEDNLSMVFDWNRIQQMDFSLYNGEPKIVQRSENPTIIDDAALGQTVEFEKIEKNDIKLHGVQESNSIDENVMKSKMAAEGKNVEENKEIKETSEVRRISETKEVRETTVQRDSGKMTGANRFSNETTNDARQKSVKRDSGSPSNDTRQKSVKRQSGQSNNNQSEIKEKSVREKSSMTKSVRKASDKKEKSPEGGNGLNFLMGLT